MDSSGYRIEFLGNSCGQHGSYTFYRGVRYWKDDKCHSLSLGEFFHGRMSSNDQVIPLIGELQLLWEEKHHEGLKLSSVRLYILPENCPGGRLPHHGQDEILAEDDKIVLRVEDLMKLVVLEPVVWMNGLLALHKFCPQDVLTGSNGLKANRFMLCQYGCQGNANNRTNSKPNGTRVVILSYSRYCRYRAALKRFEGCTNRWLADFLVSAIGGFSTCGMETRVMFCRNTVEHPVLESYECRMNHLAPSLKGRRRKQRPKSKPNESEDSNESETNSEKNSLRCKKTSEGPLEKRKPIGKLSEGGKLSELSRVNAKCKKTVVNNEKGFLKRLHKYMTDRGRPIVRIPTLGFKEVNLYQFYQCTQKLGGYNEVTEKRLWKHVYDQLGGSPGNTSAATGTRRNYEKLLLDYEQHCRNRKKQPVSAADGEMKSVSSVKDSTESSSCSFQTDMKVTVAGDGSSCSSSTVSSSQDAPKTHGTGSQSSDGSGDATQQQEVGSDEPPKRRPSIQPKNAAKSMKQRKLLRKKSVQGCSDSVLVNDTKEASFSTAKQNREAATPEQETPEEDAATSAAATDVLQPPTKSDNISLRQADDHKHIASTSSSKAIEAASTVPCKAAMTMLKTKSTGEVLENCTKGVLNGMVLPVKVEQPEPMPGEAGDSGDVDNYSCNAVVLPVPASADNINVEERKFVQCEGVISVLPQKPKSSAGSERGGKDSCVKTVGTIRTSSVSRRLLSGGHAVVESGTLDKDQSKHVLGDKTKLGPSMLPIKQVVEELLASKSLGIPHPFNGGALASPRYSLGVVSPLTPSSPGLPSAVCGLSSLEAALSSESNRKEARLSVKKESSIMSSTAIQFSVDNVHTNDATFKHAEDTCHSGVPMTTQPVTPSSICPAQSKPNAALKRSHPLSIASESHLDAKRQRTELESPANVQSVERIPTCHQTSVISSPIKRFIDRTKNWVPPLFDPAAGQTATAQSSTWTADDQPTDLSMKTLMSRQQQQSSCLSSLALPQDEPLDLSKSSTMFPRSVRIETSNRLPVVLPGSSAAMAAQMLQRNGLNLTTTSTNKVAFVAPSLRSTSSYLPTTNYQMSNLHQSGMNVSSLPQPLKPEQLAPFVAYAPFHPAFQILSTPILSALAGPGSLLCSSSSSPSAVSPRLAVPLYPVIPISQNAAISASDRMSTILEMGNPVSSAIFKRASSSRKS